MEVRVLFKMKTIEEIELRIERLTKQIDDENYRAWKLELESARKVLLWVIS